MKKYVFGLLLVIITLAGCTSGDSSNQKVSGSPSTQSTSSISKESSSIEETTVSSSDEKLYSQQTTFSDGNLDTPDFTLTIDRTQYVRNYATDEDGLVIWFTVDNKAKHNLVPVELLSNFLIQQKDETSVYDIPTDYNHFDAAEGLYPTILSDGTEVEDTDKYNEIVQQQNDFLNQYDKKAYAELMPGKTVQVAVGLTLENSAFPVTVTLQDFLLGPGSPNTSEEFTINLTPETESL